MDQGEQNLPYAVVFPGQGSQHLGMADSWADHPLGKATLEEVSELTGFDIIAGCHDETMLTTTAFVQPALLACEIAAFRILDDSGVQFAGTAGHSLGEFAALVAANVMSLQDAVNIIQIRGRAMRIAGEKNPGAMSAILGVSTERVRELCEETVGNDVLVITNENSPVQTVISGSIEAVGRAEARAKQQKIRAVRLKVAGAFHSPLMQTAVEPIREALSKVPFHAPLFPIAENVSGTLVDDPGELRELLERHVISAVKWESSIRALGAIGVNTFIEAGPGNVLTNLIKRILPDARAISANSSQIVQQLAIEF